MKFAALVFGIVGFIFAFIPFTAIGGILLCIASLVLGIIARRQCLRISQPTGIATAGVVLGGVGGVVGLVVIAVSAGIIFLLRPPSPPPEIAAAASCPIEIVKVETSILEPEPFNLAVRRLRRELVLTLYVHNKGSKKITAWNMDVDILDPFGAVLYRSNMTSADSTIAPDGTDKVPFTYQENRFLHNTPFAKLSRVSPENMRFKFGKCQVVEATAAP